MPQIAHSFWASLWISVLALALGATLSAGPLAAADACEPSGGAKPAHCPTDARIAVLDQSLRENHVFFPRGGSSLDAVARAQIDLLAQLFSTQILAGTCLKLVGHSDSVGSEGANAALSERRAEAVREALSRAMGPDAPPMVVEAKGETDLLPDLPSAHVGQRRVALWAKACAAG